MVEISKKAAAYSVAKRILTRMKRSSPKYTPKLVEQIQRDYQFLFATKILTGLLETAKVTMETRSTDPRVRKLADNLRNVWYSSIADAAECIPYGRSAFEKYYQWDEESKLQLVHGLQHLEYEHSDLVLDGMGRFAGVTIDNKVRLNADASWWVARKPTITNPHGRSIYSGAPWRVLCDRMDQYYRDQIWYDRFAMGQGVARSPSTQTLAKLYQNLGGAPVNEAGEEIDPIEWMQSMLEAMVSGGYAVLGSEKYPEELGGDYIYGIEQHPQLEDDTPIREWWNKSDEKVLRALGMPERALIQPTQTGSYNLADVQFRVLSTTAETELYPIIRSFQRYVVRKAVQLNFAGAPEDLIVLKVQPLHDAKAARNTEMFKVILDGSDLTPLITVGAIDLVEMAEAADIPIDRSEWDKKMDMLQQITLASLASKQQKNDGGNPAEQLPDSQAIPNPEM